MGSVVTNRLRQGDPPLIAARVRSGHQLPDLAAYSLQVAGSAAHGLGGSIAVVSGSPLSSTGPYLCPHTALSRPPSKAADRFQPDTGWVSLSS